VGEGASENLSENPIFIANAIEKKNPLAKVFAKNPKPSISLQIDFDLL